jgi:DNA repair exonuclease SbcCD ATPase subunit
MEKKHAEQLEKLEAKITKLNDEVAELRSQLSQSVSRNAAALQSSSQLEVQLKQKDKAFTDLETQVSERDAKIRTLETKVTAMEEVDAELEAISAPHAPLEGDPPSFELQIKLLHKKVKNKASALRNAESDVEFFRSEYQNASTSAHTEVTRANELEAKVKKLEQQLQVCLKQRDLYSQSIAKEAKAAAERSQQQLNLLMEQARRTDDTVRHKAASFERLTRERENHESELHKERSRGDQLSKRNTELRDQVALLQGRIVGAFDPVEVPDDETDDDLPSAPSARAPKSINPYLVPAFAPDNNSARPSPGLTDTTLAEGGIEMFRCKWNLKEDNMCPEIFHTRDVSIICRQFWVLD